MACFQILTLIAWWSLRVPITGAESGFHQQNEIVSSYVSENYKMNRNKIKTVTTLRISPSQKMLRKDDLTHFSENSISILR